MEYNKQVLVLALINMSQRVEAAMCLLGYGKGVEMLGNWDY